MFEPLRRIFGGKTPSRPASPPPGERLYVVGDIHGRLDLFKCLLAGIDQDDTSQGPAKTTIILLGDLVDRGPQSAAVLALARELKAQRPVRILIGNHEDMFLGSFTDTNILRHFIKHGGRETILSYGMSEKKYNDYSLEELQAAMTYLVPQADREFMQSFEEYFQMGDYTFVHAGIHPEVPLEEQRRHDMLWIRDPFLRYPHQHPGIIVHGHTIFEQVDVRSNRIGIDTGAYRSGRLTALVLEGESRRFIQAVETDSGLTIEQRDCVS